MIAILSVAQAGLPAVRKGVTPRARRQDSRQRLAEHARAQGLDGEHAEVWGAESGNDRLVIVKHAPPRRERSGSRLCLRGERPP